MKVRFSLVLLLLACCPSAKAQSLEEFKRQAQQEYSAFKKQAVEEYNNFRDKANAEYAEFMGKKWEPFKKEAPIAKPVLPEPPVAPVAPPLPRDDKREAVRLPLKEVIPIEVPIVQPKPVEPIPVPATVPVYDAFEFMFYGTRCGVGLDSRLKFHLDAADEQHVAAAWEKLSKESYNRLINECLELRQQLNLCGWGYYAMLKAMSETFLGKGDEAVLLQMFILTQSGYKVRIARCDNSLCLLMPSDYTIFSKSFLTIDNEKYYIFSNDTHSKSFHVFNRSFPGEQLLSIRMDGVPNLEADPERERTLVSKRYPELKVNAPLDKNLTAFYNDYPLNDNWTLYSLTSLSQPAKDAIYPVLEKSIEGKSKTEAANMLINFVQTAFDYKTDQEQFGYERPLFGDETLYYPYSDCEDRSILYSILTRDLLGLDVVFLYYPGEHLATAIHFDEDVKGDYLMVDGVKYLVCDPTYIGAEIGRAMPNLKSSEIRVVRIK